MQRGYEMELVSRLARVADRSFAEMRSSELLRWYDQERLSKGIWRDIEERWRDLSDDPLFVGWSDGHWKFLNGDGLTLAPSSWLTEIGGMGLKGDENTN